jgi:hypothetical protein
MKDCLNLQTINHPPNPSSLRQKKSRHLRYWIVFKKNWTPAREKRPQFPMGSRFLFV